MEVYTEILGNVHTPEWHEKIFHHDIDVENIFLDQWTAQKSRFLGKGDQNNEYAIALKRHSQIADGDVIYYDPEGKKAVVLRLALSPVLVIDMSGLEGRPPTISSAYRSSSVMRSAISIGRPLSRVRKFMFL